MERHLSGLKMLSVDGAAGCAFCARSVGVVAARTTRKQRGRIIGAGEGTNTFPPNVRCAARRGEHWVWSMHYLRYSIPDHANARTRTGMGCPASS